MKLKKISSLASFTVLATGVLASVGPVQALTLTPGSTVNVAGDITLTGIPGATDASGDPLSTLDFLLFDDPQPTFPNGPIEGVPDGYGGEFVVTGGTGSFASIDPPPFVTGFIKDLPDPAQSGDQFGFSFTNDFILFPDIEGSPVTFNLGVLGDPTYTESGGSTSVTIGANGTFDTDMQTGVPGQFVFAAEFVDRSAEEVRNILAAGGTLDSESNSGNGIVDVPSVPEPSSMIGLVAFSLAGAGVLGRKKQKQLG